MMMSEQERDQKLLLLDRLVAEHVEGWTVVEDPVNRRGWQLDSEGYSGRDLPCYTTDHNACAAAERMIIAKGLGVRYAVELLSLMPKRGVESSAVWWLAAPLVLRCGAMLTTLGIKH